MEDKYNFSKLNNRENTMSVKWDKRKDIFGREDILPLWVADSDWHTAPEIKAALIKKAENTVLGYSYADQSVKNAVKKWLEKRFELAIDKDWLVFDTGVVPALNFTLKAITEPGDGVIIQPPVYRPFFSAVKNNNCELIKNELLLKDRHYKIDFAGLEAIISEWKERQGDLKALIFCSPHNPVGRVWNKSELKRLLEILARENIYLLSDEIHSDLVYPAYNHYPSLKVIENYPELQGYRDKIITYMAASKTFNIAGLHTSYTIISSDKLRKEYNKAKNGFASGNSPFGLEALKCAYNEGEQWLEKQLEYIVENKNYLQDFIKNEIPALKLFKQEGTFLIWLDCRNLNFANDQQLREFMIEEARVGLNPGIWFGKAGSGFMRLNIACPQARLKKALLRIKNAVDKLK
ncbi:pyridoxal phosphate-dependent aminotransferase [Halanaerobium sp. Z-7514]|uniref:cysteine-S-conjugate beta-lyase n=1 Tax=Halanaerobium polyolivorans TaxID=2886943 RepID=A0AAW4WVV4_9FIRM|nr:MalY/PatB family protein [Halanaerobium polyolivorans]MCC3143858.1 pyridoxal phosphate-dependent aminotransferase [Halanaerobium polyolivorans]